MSRLNQGLFKLSMLRTYFLRGHSNWFAYVISLVNFMTISFYILIDNLDIIPPGIKFRHFILLFTITYVPLAITIGYLDMKKGTYRVEQKMAKNLSPLWNEVFERLEKIERDQSIIINLLNKTEN